MLYKAVFDGYDSDCEKRNEHNIDQQMGVMI